MGLFSAIYEFGLKCRKLGYRYIKKPGRLPVKVVSIGNITLGGTGKTPAVISVAEEAVKRGLRPCVLTRGYKGSVKDTCFVSDGDQILLDSNQAGDEAVLMAETLKKVPVVKGSKRYESGLFALRELASPPTLFILDDGFQHWALDRDLDVVLIDGTNPFDNEKVLPEGRLREPLSSLKRADIIIITKSDTADSETLSALTTRVKDYSPDAALFTASFRPSSLVRPSGKAEGLDMLYHKKIHAFSGIANPDYFRSMLNSMGAEITGFGEFRDHYVYSQKEIDKITDDADGLEIITTEKDLVKLKGLNLPDNISALSIEFTVDRAFYDQLFERLSML